MDINILKSLELYKHGKYNNAAGLLADYNSFNEIGIDIIRYGNNSMQIINDRISINGMSILNHFESCMKFYYNYIKQKDIIESERRISFMEVPLIAYREAIINAIIHRDYHRNGHNRVEFFPDRIEILSVGPLPSGTSVEEYINGSYSNVRNRILADIFYRIGYIEKMGTGIRRIKQSYMEYNVKPSFEVMRNSVKVILPFMTNTNNSIPSINISKNIDHLSIEEIKLYNYFKSVTTLKRADVEKYMSTGKTKSNNLLKRLISYGLIQKYGQGKTIYYQINK